MSGLVNKDQADEMTVEGFAFSPLKCLLTVVTVVLTGGLFLILLTWRADIKLNCVYTKVPLKEAKKVLLKDKFEQIFEEDVVCNSSGDFSNNAGPICSFFINKKIKYVWDSGARTFVKLKNVDEFMKQSDFHKCKEGLGQLTVTDRLHEYGPNLIKISVPPVLYLVFHEALNPFYLFQAYTVILWSIQMYWKFAVIIAITSVLSVTASVWETRKQNRNLRDKMKSESSVSVLRNGAQTELSSVSLVPGDVILLPTNGGVMMECDAVLIEGTCVVNESMLTGESIPITKISIPDEDTVHFAYDLQRQHVVFCGTEILQGKAQEGHFIKAVVIRTGFMTTKGELVRAILFPPPLDFQFHSDFLKSIYVFLSLGLIGMAYSLYMWISNGGTIQECLLNSLDILTFVVPPILPAALTANNAFAQKRLQKMGIFCLHSKHICLCGGIDVVAFDKTGTLTEGNLDLAGVCETKNANFQETQADPTLLALDSRLVQAMATCHSLIKLKGELTGNPLDVKLFDAIEWELQEQHNMGINPDYGMATPTLVSPPKGSRNGSGHIKTAPSNLEIAILKTYPFDSAVQRMTTVTKKKGAQQFDVYIKGAPEKIASTCKPETIPADFASTLMWYTKQGLRVIAAAHKPLNANYRWKEVDDLTRAELEQKADFLGLIIMQNLVKAETYGAIKELHEADINTVMVTGDNILTAISVGRDCELVKPDQTIIRVEAELSPNTYTPSLNVAYMLEENEKSNIVHDSNFIKSVQEKNYVFACDGKTFGLIRNNDKALLDRIVQRGKIFARMLPEQKIHLIECMKDLGRQVIMCGDGCNDCGALKTAHAGISLSMAEASVAAPFTSRNVHIGCVPYLIREGRATMVSAFASFKFGVAFCFTQLIAVLMIFYIGTEPSDNQYLVVDIGLAALPIIMIGNCGPHEILIKQKPMRHLLSFLPLFSVISFLFFQTLGYVGVWFYVQMQSWFVPYKFEPGLWPPNPSYEQTCIFLLSCCAAVVAAIVFSKGSPYRKPLITNGIMAVWTIAAVAATIFMSLYESQDFAERLNFKIPPSMDFRLVIVGVMVFSCIFCYLWEIYFIDGVLFAKVLPWYKIHVRGPHLPFERLEEELRSKAGWPPIGDCKNNEIKIAVSMQSGSSSFRVTTPTTSTTSSQNKKNPTNHPNEIQGGVATQIRHASREVTRNIKNRWSAGSPQQEEEHHLLGATETPTVTPRPQRAAQIDKNTLPPSYSLSSIDDATPSSSQLQRVINNTLLPAHTHESKMLSTWEQQHQSQHQQNLSSSTATTGLLGSSADKKETIC